MQEINSRDDVSSWAEPQNLHTQLRQYHSPVGICKENHCKLNINIEEGQHREIDIIEKV
jgi:hypothetical protein